MTLILLMARSFGPNIPIISSCDKNRLLLVCIFKCEEDLLYYNILYIFSDAFINLIFDKLVNAN